MIEHPTAKQSENPPRLKGFSHLNQTSILGIAAVNIGCLEKTLRFLF